MKWNTLMICIGILTAVVSITGNLHTIEGGSESLIVARDPFYSQAGYCDININLYSPVNSTTYYNNNVLLNMSITGADTCYYKIEGYGWNSVSCVFNDTRTLMEGDLTLTVRGENGLCSKEESVSFTVYNKQYALPLQPMVVFIMCSYFIILLGMWVYIRRKKPARHQDMWRKKIWRKKKL